MLAISGIYVVIIALLAMILGAMVSIHRAKANISILHGDDMQLAEKMRRHGNLAETAPFALLLLIVAEASGGSAMWLHIAGIILVISRLLHPLGLKHENPNEILRGVGAGGTSISMLISIVLIASNWF